LPAGVVPEHGHLAAVAGAVPLQDLDRGGLARPVRPEQGEDLAPADVQVDAVHGPHARVGLHQPAHVHRGRAAVAGAAGRCAPGPGLARPRGHAVIPARSPGSPASLSPAVPAAPGPVARRHDHGTGATATTPIRGYEPVKPSMTALTTVAVLAPMTEPTTVSPG